MKRLPRLPRWGRWVARMVFVPLGLAFGYIISDNIIINYNLLPQTSPYFMPWCILGSLIGGIFLLWIGPLFCRLLYARVSKDSHLYKKNSPSETISASIGLACGLFIAFLITRLYTFIPTNYELITITLSIVTYIGLGITGTIIGLTNLKEIIDPKNTTTVLTPKLLDSSILIDARIVDVVKTGFVTGPFVIPNFIIDELRNIADNSDSLKRNRGRRGLEAIKTLQSNKENSVVIDESVLEGPIETKLITLAKELKAEIITVNYNLIKVAEVKDIKTLNINDLSNAIKPIALPGEKMTLEIVKQGKDNEQGVAYLPDGTMIVVENGGNNIGDRVEVVISTSLQTNTGRIIFGRIPE